MGPMHDRHAKGRASWGRGATVGSRPCCSSVAPMVGRGRGRSRSDSPRALGERRGREGDWMGSPRALRNSRSTPSPLPTIARPPQPSRPRLASLPAPRRVPRHSDVRRSHRAGRQAARRGTLLQCSAIRPVRGERRVPSQRWKGRDGHRDAPAVFPFRASGRRGRGRRRGRSTGVGAGRLLRRSGTRCPGRGHSASRQASPRLMLVTSRTRRSPRPSRPPCSRPRPRCTPAVNEARPAPQVVRSGPR